MREEISQPAKSFPNLIYQLDIHLYVIYSVYMEKTIVSARELQRNYRQLINRVKTTKRPIYLGTHLKPEAVLVDLDEFNKLHQPQFRTQTWEEIKRDLDAIRAHSKPSKKSLAEFIHEDRQRH